MRSVLLIVVLCGVAAGQETVRNDNPEPALDPPDQSGSIYYPLRGSESDAAEAAPAGSPEHLLWRYRELHSTSRYAEALEVAEVLVERVPDRPLPHYNHACTLARLRRTNEAFAALDRAVDHGWREVEHLRIDPDLHPLRHDDRFAVLLQRVRTLCMQEWPRQGPLRDDAWPQVVHDLEARVPRELERFHVPGVSIALIRGGSVVWSGGFGVACRESSRPMAGHTPFRLRAPVNLLTTVASLRLQEEGELDLSEVLRYCLDTGPDAPVLRRVAGTGSAAQALDRRPAPGLMRLAVEMSGDWTFRDYCRTRVLEPLGMIASDWAGDPVVFGHSHLGTPLGPPAPEGTVVTTAADLGLLAAALAGGGERPWGAVGRELLALGRLDWQTGRVLGLPMQVTEGRRGTCVRIIDRHDGVGCLIRWYPEAGAGVVVLDNSDTAGPASRRIAAIALLQSHSPAAQ